MAHHDRRPDIPGVEQVDERYLDNCAQGLTKIRLLNIYVFVAFKPICRALVLEVRTVFTLISINVREFSTQVGHTYYRPMRAERLKETVSLKKARVVYIVGTKLAAHTGPLSVLAREDERKLWTPAVRMALLEPLSSFSRRLSMDEAMQ